MERLKDQRAAADPIMASAARLLSAVPPRASSTLSEQRVWARLRDPMRPRVSAWLRPAVAFAVVLVVGIASAMWIRHGRRVRPMVPVPVILPAVAGSAATPAATLPVVVIDALPTPRQVKVRPALPTEVPPPGPSAAVDEGSALVLTATRILRRNQDPVRAGILLEDYVTQHPTGALIEEAYALAIEAAVARHDGSAEVLARQYLSRFPGARFRDAAKRVIESDEM